MKTIILELPETKALILEKKAKEFGQSVSEFIASILDNLSDEADFDVTQDAIYNIKPSGNSGLSDLAKNHDHYLYGAKKK